MNSNVLIVDDCESICKVISGALEIESISYTVCMSGIKAKSLIYTHKFSTVILDINLADADSFELATKIRQQSLLTQIIILSGNLNESIFYEFHPLGISDFFQKSHLNLVHILESIKLGHSRQERWSSLFPEIK